MDFTLDQKHEMARDLFKQFAETEVKPLAQETDETEVFPAETVAKMGKYGFMGIPVPKEYGGQGCDPLTYVMCVEELSKVCGTTGVIVSAHTSLCIDPIMTFGTEEQKKKYVPDLASGKKIGAFGLTEPGAGTDAQGCQTKAVLDGDEWVLNGSKCFITNGKVADVYIIIAITSITEDKRGRKKKNFSAFIVDKGTPGFSFGTKEKKMGIRGSSTYELIFEDARIPKDALLGKEGRGFPIAMHTLDDVFEAKIHSGLAILSNSANVVFLTCISSKAASTMRSQSLQRSSFKPGVMLARMPSTFSCVIFSFATSLAYPFAILSFPPSAHSCLISQSATSYPSTCANAFAIPWPIVPAPITPTFILVPPK